MNAQRKFSPQLVRENCRNYWGWTRKEREESAIREFNQILNKGDCVSESVLVNGLYDAFVVCFIKEWDSGFFSRNCGKVVCSFSPETEKEVRSKMIKGALKRAIKELYIEHFEINIHSSDFSTLNVLLDHGFRIFDYKSFLYLHGRDCARFRRARRIPFGAREFCSQDAEELMGLVEAIELPSRYFRDPFYPDSSVVSMQRQWVNRFVEAQEDKRTLMVAESGGHLVGFGGSLLREIDTGSRKIRVMGSTLFGCASGYGHYSQALLYSMTRDSLSKADVIENVIGPTNYTIPRTLEHYGFKTEHGEVVLHKDVVM